MKLRQGDKFIELKVAQNYQTELRCPGDFHPSINCAVKRTIDIMGSIFGLVITTILFLPIATAIYLDDPGPVLFCQTRVGFRGKPFRLWKFRSMIKNAEALKYTIENQAIGQIFKNDEDPRVTRVGKFLRKTSLDELPQFWNVLMGNMSLVGTRPPIPDEVAEYSLYHWLRLEVKPGITGVWQVNGRSSIKNFEEVVQLDLSYQRNWSIGYDLYLIILTLRIVFLGRGAY